jgi:hypothetical protein
MGLVVSGCSSGDELPREAVSGTVMLDGQPLAGGVIQFTPASPEIPQGGGSPITGGRFSIPRAQGLVPGTYRVTVNAASSETTVPKGEPVEPGKPPEPGRPTRTARAKELIPAKYNAESELKAEVKKGVPNEFTFTLQSK